MSVSLDPFTVVAGTSKTLTFPVNGLGPVEAVKVTNESVLPCKPSGLGPGTGPWLAGWTEDLYRLGPNSLPSSMTFTAQSISNAANPPSTVVLVTLYYVADHDAPRGGAWPLALARQVNLGSSNTATTQVIQDGQATGQIIVEATPLNLPQLVLVTTDGHILSRRQDAGSPVFDWLGKLSGGNTPVLNMAPSDGATSWGLFYNANGVLTFYESVNNKTALQLGPTGTSFPQVPISQINGQTTAGSFGVPVVVAQALRTLVTVTTLQTILTFSIPANGLYRLSAALEIHNATASNKPTFNYQFTDASGAADTGSFYAEDPVSGNVRALNGGNCTFGANFGNVAISPEVSQMNAGTLTVKYQSTVGTPNDTVSVLVERLA